MVTYTFTNGIDEQVIFDVYGSQEDYRDNTNRLSRDTIAPTKALKLPFEPGRTIWVDWYTTDYAHSNWHNVQTVSQITSEPRAKLVIAAEGDQITLSKEPFGRDSSRSVLMNGSGTSSSWQLEIPLQSGRKHPGIHRFRFRKDFTCEHTLITPAGDSTSDMLEYMVAGTRTGNGDIQAIPFVIYAIDSKSTMLEGRFDYRQHDSRDTLNCAYDPYQAGIFLPTIRR